MLRITCVLPASLRRRHDHKIGRFEELFNYTFREDYVPRTPLQRLRHHTLVMFEDPLSSRPAFLLNIFIIILIAFSTLSFMIETIPQYYEKYDTTWFILELIVVIPFTLEYAIRLACTPRPLNFLIAPMNVVDVLAVLPFWLTLIIGIILRSTSVKFLRFLRVFRVLRVLKIGRHSTSFKVLIKSLVDAYEAVILLVVFVIMAMVFWATLLFFAENIEEEYDSELGVWIYDRFDEVEFFYGEETSFQSIAHSLWWALVTMTTVGYGDTFPVTPYGKTVAGLCILSGIIIISFPVAIISNTFAENYALAMEESADIWNKGTLDRAEELVRITPPTALESEDAKISAVLAEMHDIVALCHPAIGHIQEALQDVKLAIHFFAIKHH